MRGIRDIAVLENIPVLVRAALNAPVENGKVANDYRLRRALLTIEYLRRRRARIVLISHIGEEGIETLAPVAGALGHFIARVSFCPETIGERVRSAVRALQPGDVLVLENLRRHKGERTNDETFARELAHLADVFVQDSFDTCHRMHASIVGVPRFLPSYAGLLLEEEVLELGRALSPARPSLAIIGGAKSSTKEAVLTALLRSYTQVFVGGALANDFLKAAGREVGKSLVAGEDATRARRLLGNSKLILPIDSLVVPSAALNSSDAKARARTAGLGEVGRDDVILDHGPATAALLTDLVSKMKTILWNGPLGNYERGFTDTTNAVAHAIAETRSHSIVGGGDTIAAIEKLGLLGHFSFVSTGGGAMLEYLAHGTLPGIEALS